LFCVCWMNDKSRLFKQFRRAGRWALSHCDKASPAFSGAMEKKCGPLNTRKDAKSSIPWEQDDSEDRFL
jgi:hypothetical protein